MPLYRYVCEQCGHSFKILYTHDKDGHKPTCPECESSSVKRVISSVGIRFKGDGFYRTDYKDNGGVANSNSSEKENQTSEESG
ncbi:MAG: FmdB family zinc ribbon protein, partial [Candidatus Acetothermia bacterium]